MKGQVRKIIIKICTLFFFIFTRRNFLFLMRLAISDLDLLCTVVYTTSSHHRDMMWCVHIHITFLFSFLNYFNAKKRVIIANFFSCCESHGIVGVCCGPPFSVWSGSLNLSRSCVLFFAVVPSFFHSWKSVSERERRSVWERGGSGEFTFQKLFRIEKFSFFWIELNSRHDSWKKKFQSTHRGIHFMHVCWGMR